MLIEGKGGIEAECLLNTRGHYADIATLRIRFPRFVAEQFLKHRMFSCNAVSSRALSVPKMNKWIEDNPAFPIFWGAQQKGMQPSEELDDTNGYDHWVATRNECLDRAQMMWVAGYHQQIPNRLTHAFQMAEYIVTATDWKNFFNLRLHDKAAQSEINELARCMYEVLEGVETSDPHEGWHLPYVTEFEKDIVPIEELKIVSAARCCIISYNNHGTDKLLTIDKAKRIFSHLITDTNPHYTPLEHQARVLTDKEDQDLKLAIDFAPEQLSQRKLEQLFYYANLNGWISHRYELEEQY